MTNPSWLKPIVSLVRQYSVDCPLRIVSSHDKGATEHGTKLIGQCENASALFHLLVGGSKTGWKMMRIGPDVWPEYGPHYFVKHESGLIVDPTFDQFPKHTKIPYELAKGQTAGGFRKIPLSTKITGLDLSNQTTTKVALETTIKLIKSHPEVVKLLKQARKQAF